MDMDYKFKTFISFLKKKGCYESFKENYYLVEKERPYYHHKTSVRRLFYDDVWEVILMAFDWENTLEGHHYWDAIDDDWRDLVDENGW